MEPIPTLVAASFALLALFAARLWWRQRSVPTLWVLGMCSTLAVGLLLSFVVTPALPGIETTLSRVGLLAILAFPYLLFRFAASFRHVPRLWEIVAAAMVAATLLAALAVTSPQQGEQPPIPMGLVIVAMVGTWTALTAWVVWSLARSGLEQPTVAKRRMWTLAVAAAMLDVALVLALVGTGETLSEAAYVLALASAGVFLLAFAPPRFVRVMWRESDERELHSVESDLMAATTRAEVVATMLSHVNRLLGGSGALFIDREGEPLTQGMTAPDASRHASEVAAAALRDGGPGAAGDLIAMDLREGRLGVVASPYMPLFGKDELDLLEWLGTLTDLALSRADLYDGERSARAHAQSLAAELEALVYGISHDLRSPMVSVHGYLAYLTEEHGERLDADGRHALSRIRANTEYMDKLISDLLELSRAGDVQEDAKAVDMAALARDIAEEVNRGHPEATFEIGPLPMVLMSPPRARQLLLNLLGNAAAHSGRPDVTVRVVSTAESASQVCLAVIDDGRGIPPAWRERVFGIFERVGGDEPGGRHSSGIGLAITRKIVERAGGRIWIADSESGTDVRIQLLPASGLAPDGAAEG